MKDKRGQKLQLICTMYKISRKKWLSLKPYRIRDRKEAQLSKRDGTPAKPDLQGNAMNLSQIRKRETLIS